LVQVAYPVLTSPFGCVCKQMGFTKNIIKLFDS
jgi:hypothetical protein